MAGRMLASVKRPAPTSPVGARVRSGRLQRCGGTHCPPGTCGHQRAPSPAAAVRSAVPAAVHAEPPSGGRPLDALTRTRMESRFGHDFGRVRVHTDQRAGSSAQAVGARAYTVADQIVFGPGQYAPQTTEGMRLLAHELTHVLQQRQGGTSAQASAGTDEDDQAEREARSVADRVVAGTLPPSPAVRTAPLSLQRFNVEDCTIPEEKAITTAATTARSCIPKVVGLITSANPSPVVTAALTTYFGLTGPNSAATIAASLNVMEKGIASAGAECERTGGWFNTPAYEHFCGGGAAYTRVPLASWFNTGNIHICQPQFHTVLSALQQRTTIIHEAGHRFLHFGPEAEAYYTIQGCQQTAETQALTDPLRLVNADSYACLVEILC
jgi:hypothetical protein